MNFFKEDSVFILLGVPFSHSKYYEKVLAEDKSFVKKELKSCLCDNQFLGRIIMEGCVMEYKYNYFQDGLIVLRLKKQFFLLPFCFLFKILAIPLSKNPCVFLIFSQTAINVLLNQWANFQNINISGFSEAVLGKRFLKFITPFQTLNNHEFIEVLYFTRTKKVTHPGTIFQFNFLKIISCYSNQRVSKENNFTVLAKSKKQIHLNS